MLLQHKKYAHTYIPTLHFGYQKQSQGFQNHGGACPHILPTVGIHVLLHAHSDKKDIQSIALLTIDPLRWSGEWWCPSMLPDLLLSSSEVLLPSEVMSADTLLVRGVMLIDLSR